MSGVLLTHDPLHRCCGDVHTAPLVVLELDVVELLELDVELLAVELLDEVVVEPELDVELLVLSVPELVVPPPAPPAPAPVSSVEPWAQPKATTAPSIHHAARVGR